MEQHQDQVTRCKLDQAGRILIPADVRQRLHIAPGDELILEIERGRITVSTFQNVLREAQEFVSQNATPGESVVDELIRERSVEAALE